MSTTLTIEEKATTKRTEYSDSSLYRMRFLGRKTAHDFFHCLTPRLLRRNRNHPCQIIRSGSCSRLIPLDWLMFIAPGVMGVPCTAPARGCGTVGDRAVRLAIVGPGIRWKSESEKSECDASSVPDIPDDSIAEGRLPLGGDARIRTGGSRGSGELEARRS